MRSLCRPRQEVVRADRSRDIGSQDRELFAQVETRRELGDRGLTVADDGRRSRAPSATRQGGLRLPRFAW